MAIVTLYYKGNKNKSMRVPSGDASYWKNQGWGTSSGGNNDAQKKKDADAKKKKEADAKRKREQDAQRKRDADAKRKREQDARRRAEEKRQADAKRQANDRRQRENDKRQADTKRQQEQQVKDMFSKYGYSPSSNDISYWRDSSKKNSVGNLEANLKKRRGQDVTKEFEKYGYKPTQADINYWADPSKKNNVGNLSTNLQQRQNKEKADKEKKQQEEARQAEQKKQQDEIKRKQEELSKQETARKQQEETRKQEAVKKENESKKQEQQVKDMFSKYGYKPTQEDINYWKDPNKKNDIGNLEANLGERQNKEQTTKREKEQKEIAEQEKLEVVEQTKLKEEQKKVAEQEKLEKETNKKRVSDMFSKYGYTPTQADIDYWSDPNKKNDVGNLEINLSTRKEKETQQTTPDQSTPDKTSGTQLANEQELQNARNELASLGIPQNEWSKYISNPDVNGKITYTPPTATLDQTSPDQSTPDQSTTQDQSNTTEYDPYAEAAKYGYSRADFANDPGFADYWKNKTPEQLKAELMRRGDFDTKSGTKVKDDQQVADEGLTDEQKASQQEGHNWIDEMIKDGKVSEGQALILHEIFSGDYTSGQKIPSVQELQGIIAQAATNAEIDLSPYYEKMEYRDMQDIKQSLADIRSEAARETGREKVNYKQQLSQAKQSLRQRGMTFSGASRQKLGAEGALQAQGVEGTMPTDRRLGYEERTAGYQQRARDIGIEAERKWGTGVMTGIDEFGQPIDDQSWLAPYGQQPGQQEQTQPGGIITLPNGQRIHPDDPNYNEYLKRQQLGQPEKQQGGSWRSPEGISYIRDNTGQWLETGPSVGMQSPRMKPVDDPRPPEVIRQQETNLRKKFPEQPEHAYYPQQPQQQLGARGNAMYQDKDGHWQHWQAGKPSSKQYNLPTKPQQPGQPSYKMKPLPVEPGWNRRKQQPGQQPGRPKKQDMFGSVWTPQGQKSLRAPWLSDWQKAGDRRYEIGDARLDKKKEIEKSKWDRVSKYRRY